MIRFASIGSSPFSELGFLKQKLHGWYLWGYGRFLIKKSTGQTAVQANLGSGSRDFWRGVKLPGKRFFVVTCAIDQMRRQPMMSECFADVNGDTLFSTTRVCVCRAK